MLERQRDASGHFLPDTDTPEDNREVVGYDPQTGEPQYKEDRFSETPVSWNAKTGEPVYARKTVNGRDDGNPGRYQYFSTTFGTVWADSIAEAIEACGDHPGNVTAVAPTVGIPA